MKKKKIVLFLAIISISITIITIKKNYSNTKKYIKQDGMLLAVSDGSGNTLNAIPSKGMYRVNVNCNNANGSWDYVNWQLKVADVNGSVTCDLTFDTISTTYLNNYITGLCNSGTTLGTCSSETASSQGTGALVYENGVRYEGKNPNNYVLFNNELWRIIGVFDSTSHGQSGNLVKIIRDDSIGGYTWDSAGTNDWPNSSLYHLLNGAYYDWDTNGSSVNSYCYGYSSTVLSNCDLSASGIQDGYRPMIVNAKWYLGGPGAENYTTYYPDDVYTYERTSAAKNGTNSDYTTGYIGLMYLSDYGYSVLSSSCTRNSYLMTNTNGYSSPNCAGNSWIYGNGGEYTITPNSNNSNGAWSLAYTGIVNNSDANFGLVVRPVLYLNSSVYLIDGNGSIETPYIIGM